MREPLRPHDPIATVSAGGIAPLGAKLADDQRSSPVTARAYAHPGLDGKVVIRLEPDVVAAGSDAEMAAFGFDEPEVSAPLGKVRTRTLGFPAWALVHEPKKAAAALAVTDELRKAKRLVAAKRGHAKEAFEAIAKKLQRGAPQFLPSFWEEVGRVVADQASQTMAAQCFERARQAERAYLHNHYKDFLGKPRRELLGLKLGDADTARTALKTLPEPDLHALIALAVPDDPAQIFTGGFVDGLARAWKQKFGKRAKVPPDLLKDAKTHLRLGDALTTMLPVFAGEADAAFLEPDLRPLNELGSWGDEQGLDARQARDLATLLAWLFVARPVGDPIRGGIPAVMARLRSVLDSKAIWRIDELRISDEDPKEKARRQAILDLVGGKAMTMGKDGGSECLRAHDDGALIVAAYPHNLIAGYRPAKLDGPAKRKAEQLAQAMFNADVDPDGDPLADLRLVALLRSDDFAALAERVETTPVEEGGFEANPLASATKLVAKVAKAKKLTEAAAGLYLQTLALAEPTQRDVTRWNSWTSKQYAAASSELVKAKLLVEGKRERWGRSMFLKG
ncbi:MAG: hypothetical protein H0T46_15280, partial [Deltaproteobacteria bacterium]|nr:hypothetical protein [Deltaproteobacteria bacterium]